MTPVFQCSLNARQMRIARENAAINSIVVAALDVLVSHSRVHACTSPWLFSVPNPLAKKLRGLEDDKKCMK